MTVLQRYLLIQVPGWILAALVLYALHRWLGLPAWLAWTLMAAEVVKDFVLYPFLRRAYETGEPTGSERLIGRVGVVRQAVAPRGYIELQGELWLAEAAPGAASMPSGARVRVIDAQGLTLVVQPLASGDA